MDASQSVGLGHIVRTLDLAKSIRSRQADFNNVDIHFATQTAEILPRLNKAGFFSIHQMHSDEEESLEEIVLTLKPNVLFIDKLFEYSSDFIRSLKLHTRVIMFHNLCEGGYCSDTFILPAAHVASDVLEDSAWSKGGAKLRHGFEYVIINDDIRNLKEHMSGIARYEPPVVAITTGGSDPSGVLLKLLQFLPDPEHLPYRAKILVGESFVHHKELSDMNLEAFEHLDIMPYSTKALLDSSFVIATFGVTSYELLYLKIPQLSVGHSARNALGSEILSTKCETLKNLGLMDSLTSLKFQTAFKKMIAEYLHLKRDGCEIDGMGKQRVVDEIVSLCDE